MLGLLVGDAVGVPYEFNAAEELPPLDEIDMDPPVWFRRSHRGARRYAWSDDGAHALCLLASLLHCDRLDLRDLGNRLVNWNDWGYMAVDGHVFDIGIQTSRAISNLKSGRAPEQCGPNGEYDNGNGALMRVLSLALWHRGSDAELADDAARQSLVTHGHLRSQVACALYCLWARYELHGASEPWPQAVEEVRALAAGREGWLQELEDHVAPEPLPHGSGGGYVVDCLHSAATALRADSFRSVVQRAIALGNDTDTTAAVAGGIAGIRYGVDGIPEAWLQKLAGRGEVEPLLAALTARYH